MIDEAGNIKPKRRKTKFRQISDEVLRMVAAKWNIPASVIGGKQSNFHGDKSDSWKRRQ